MRSKVLSECLLFGIVGLLLVVKVESIHSYDIPNTSQILKFQKKDGTSVNLYEELAANAVPFGICLLGDKKTKNIEHSKRIDGVEAITRDIFGQWLDGKGKRPVTWATLVECLKTMELMVLVDMIEDVYEHREIQETLETDTTEKPMYDLFFPPVAHYDAQLIKDFLPGIKIILHVVNEKERAAVLHRLEAPGPINMFHEPNKIILGMFGGYKVAVVQTKMGAECRDEMEEALRSLPDVKVILAIGVAWGMPDHEFGDVLISTIIHSLVNIRLVPDKDIPMVPRAGEFDSIRVVRDLENVFIRGAGSWNNFNCSKERICKVKDGEMISAPYLIQSKVARDHLISQYPEKKIIGGDMEGGIDIQITKNPEFSKRNIGVMIIKAVVDYADQNKKDGKKWQFTGALAAVDFAHTKLQATDGKAFTSMKHRNADEL